MFIFRDESGAIRKAVRHDPDGLGELVADDDPDLVAFLEGPVARRLVRRSVIIDRLAAAGKLAAAASALAAADVYTRERWNARTAIYADDPTAVAFLTSLGVDPAEVLKPETEEEKQ